MYKRQGRDRRRILDSAEVRSYLPAAADEAIAFLRKHMAREAVIGPVKRSDLWTFPVVAVREAVINAICLLYTSRALSLCRIGTT